MSFRDSEVLRVNISYAQIFRTSLPISFAILIPQINFIANNIFLGHFDNSGNALAVAGLTGVYYLIFSAIGYGLNNGLQSLISRRAGENKPDEIGLLFSQGIIISWLLAIAGMLITWFGLPLVFDFFIHDPQKKDLANHFLSVRIWGLPFLFLYQMRNALLVGINQSRYLVWGTIAEVLANLFFDYVLIFGKLGFPGLGFQGAAYASVISEVTGVLVIYLVLRKTGISRSFGLFSGFRFRPAYMKEILQLSYPLMFQQALSIASWEYFFLLLEHHGTTALQVSNAMRNVFGICGSSSWAFAAAANSLVANISGQNREQEIWKLLGKILLVSGSVALMMLTLLNLFPREFLSVYGQGSDFFETGLPTIRVVSVAMILMTFSSVLLNAVIATGNSRFSFGCEVFSLIAYLVFVWIAVEKMHCPVYIAWMSEWIYWIFLGIPCFLYLIFRKPGIQRQAL